MATIIIDKPDVVKSSDAITRIMGKELLCLTYLIAEATSSPDDLEWRATCFVGDRTAINCEIARLSIMLMRGFYGTVESYYSDGPLDLLSIAESMCPLIDKPNGHDDIRVYDIIPNDVGVERAEERRNCYLTPGLETRLTINDPLLWILMETKASGICGGTIN